VHPLLLFQGAGPSSSTQPEPLSPAPASSCGRPTSTATTTTTPIPRGRQFQVRGAHVDVSDFLSLRDRDRYGTDTTDEDGKFDFLTYRPGILRRGRTRTSLPLHGLARVANGGPTFPDLGDAVLLQGNSHQRFPDLLQLDVTEAKLYGFGGYVNGTIVPPGHRRHGELDR